MIAVSDREYCKYLKKYGATYRVRKNPDGVYVILGKYCQIQPDEFLQAETLLAVCLFASTRHMTGQLKKISKTGVPTHMRQVCEAECVFSFNEADLPRLAGALRLYRRRRDYKGAP